MSIIAPIAESLLDVPFNDFELYHQPSLTGNVEMGGNCVFLCREFLRKLTNVCDASIQAEVFRAREMLHYAMVLEIDGELCFYDPFLRMNDAIPIPANSGESSGVFHAHPQGERLKMDYELIGGKKRSKRYVVVRKHMTIVGGGARVSNFHSYVLNKDFVVMRDEADISYERKNLLEITVLEKINNIRRMFKLVFVLRDGKNYFTSSSSCGDVGTIRDEPDVFRENLEPIQGRLGMSYEELLEYVRHAVDVRAEMRTARFAQKGTRPE